MNKNSYCKVISLVHNKPVFNDKKRLGIIILYCDVLLINERDEVTDVTLMEETIFLNNMR